MKLFRTTLIALALLGAVWAQAQSTITFIHTNDLHAHATPTKVKGVLLGGYSRQATIINKLKASETNPVLLSGGDTFQGTLYFNEYEGLADLAFMNLMGYQAMAVGNHEFDRGPATLATFIKNARFPLLAANLDVSDDPDLRGLVQPSTVIQLADGSSLGVVGAITPDVINISSPGKHVKLKDLVPSIQAEVDKFRSEGVKRVIMLSHVGYQEEQDVAMHVKGLDVVVGGHSHTLLGDPGVKGVTGAGAYPTVVKDPDGRTVLVVQAWEWGKVVGKLKVNFDANGDVATWEGGPIAVTQDVPENPYVAGLYAAFDMPIAKLRSTNIGAAATDLLHEPSEHGDCLMGNVIADAMLAATTKFNSVAAFTNSGGVRANVDAGPVTYGQLIEVTPFGNTLVVQQLSGAELRAALEEGVGNGLLFPSAGTSYTVDRTQPAGHQIESLIIGGKPVEDGAMYTVTMNSYVAGGGDKHVTLANAKGARQDTGIVDLDALIDYFKANSPVSAKDERRITH